MEKNSDPLTFQVTENLGQNVPLRIPTQRKTIGTFSCVCCGLELFRSDAKFESGCGWLVFEPLDGAHMIEVMDTSFGRIRTEVRCSK